MTFTATKPMRRHKIWAASLVDISYRIAVGVALYVFDSLLFLLLPPSAADPDRVLVVRLDKIGDFVLWAPTAAALRRLYPRERYQMALLGNKLWTDLAERCGIFDVVIPLNTYRFIWDPIYRFRTVRALRRAGYSTVIHPTFSREFYRGDAIVRLSGARERIGSIGDHSNMPVVLKRISDRWYTKLIPASKIQMKELERNAEFVRGLGVKEFQVTYPKLPVDHSVLPHSLIAQQFYVLFPGAKWPGRRWPVERFVEIARRIYQRTGWIGVVCGGPEDNEIARLICSLPDFPLVDLAGVTSLGELVSIISHARLVVTNDTSAVHVAAAVDAPSVCISGGGHYGRFLPYRISESDESYLPSIVAYQMECFGCNWRCIYNVTRNHPVPCIAQVTVDMVWRAVSDVLDRICVSSESVMTLK